MPPSTYTDIDLLVTQGVACVTLKRPDRRNAFDGAMVAQLLRAFHELTHAPDVNLVVLQAEGPTFCAGADLNWMRQQGEQDQAANQADAQQLANMLWALAQLPMPVVASVQGDCHGGGVGLVAACDVVLASSQAGFRLSEVKLGLIPATIGPHVVRAIGARQAQRLFITAERLTADDACRLGLVHEVCAPLELLGATQELVSRLQRNGPQAMRAAKRLVHHLANHPFDEAARDWTAQQIAQVRAGDEAREGMQAFLQRRPAGWCPAAAPDVLH